MLPKEVSKKAGTTRLTVINAVLLYKLKVLRIVYRKQMVIN